MKKGKSFLELFNEFKKTGDKSLRQECLLKMLPLVKNVAGRMAMGFPKTVELGDLINTGFTGLVEAFNHFDPARGFKFETYAVPRIRGAILDEMRALDMVSRKVRSEQRELNRSILKLSHLKGSVPSDDDISRDLGITGEEFDKRINDLAPTILSLDEMIYGEEDNRQVPRVETIVDHTNLEHQLHELLNSEQNQLLLKLSSHLDPQEITVLMLYYTEKLTRADISKIMEVSESRVSQIHTKTIRKLQNLAISSEYVCREEQISSIDVRFHGRKKERELVDYNLHLSNAIPNDIQEVNMSDFIEGMVEQLKVGFHSLVVDPMTGDDAWTYLFMHRNLFGLLHDSKNGLTRAILETHANILREIMLPSDESPDTFPTRMNIFVRFMKTVCEIGNMTILGLRIHKGTVIVVDEDHETSAHVPSDDINARLAKASRVINNLLPMPVDSVKNLAFMLHAYGKMDDERVASTINELTKVKFSKTEIKNFCSNATMPEALGEDDVDSDFRSGRSKDFDVAIRRVTGGKIGLLDMIKKGLTAFLTYPEISDYINKLYLYVTGSEPKTKITAQNVEAIKRTHAVDKTNHSEGKRGSKKTTGKPRKTKKGKKKVTVPGGKRGDNKSTGKPRKTGRGKKNVSTGGTVVQRVDEVLGTGKYKRQVLAGVTQGHKPAQIAKDINNILQRKGSDVAVTTQNVSNTITFNPEIKKEYDLHR